MKPARILPFFLLLLSLQTSAQVDTTTLSAHNYPVRKLTVEPAIGVNPYPNSDLLLTNLVQWNSNKRLALVAYTSFAFNNAFERSSGHLRSDHNHTLSQKFGIGTSRYCKRAVHSIALLAGVRYDAFQETWVDAEHGDVTASVKTTAPDVGLMYNVKVGRQMHYFSFRTYVPLYPFPMKTLDPWSLDANLAAISLEFGVGIRLK